MRHYVNYDPATGEIRRSGTCQDADFGRDFGDGSAWLNAVGSHLSGYVSNGVLVPYTAEQAAAKVARPMYPARWDNATLAWIDTRPLSSLKAVKLEELRDAAHANDQADLTVQSTSFKADTATRDELMREAQVALMAQVDGQAYSLDWERANGNDITLTGSQAKALVRAMRNRSVSIRAQLRALRNQVAAAQSKAELDAIVWADV